MTTGSVLMMVDSLSEDNMEVRQYSEFQASENQNWAKFRSAKSMTNLKLRMTISKKKSYLLCRNGDVV